jgi:hypothetical protein
MCDHLVASSDRHQEPVARADHKTKSEQSESSVSQAEAVPQFLGQFAQPQPQELEPHEGVSVANPVL